MAIDNLFSGNYNNIKHLENHKLSVLKTRVTSKFNFEKFDFIFNLASPASPKFYQHNPIKTLVM